MDRSIYDAMAAHDATHWWYVARREVLRDLIARLGDPGFVRVRFGVSRPPPGWDPADYVLGKWTPEEESVLGERVGEAGKAVEHVIRVGAQAAMNRLNTKPKAAPPTPRTGPGGTPEA